MAWIYEDWIMYGVNLTIQSDHAAPAYKVWVRHMLSKHANLMVGYSGLESNQIFIALRSQVRLLHFEQGIYTETQPDTLGTICDPPRHPVFAYMFYQRLPPITKPEEELLRMLQNKLGGVPCWLRRATMFY